MSETLTAAEFELRVSRASERIDEIRGTQRVVGASPTALPYAGLDLGLAAPEMVEVLSALLAQAPDEALTHNARIEVAARRVSLALLTHLLQSGQGLADFNRRYEEMVGDAPDLAGLARIVVPALREAGLPLSGVPDPRRILEQLMGVVGLSQALLHAGVQYFCLYWSRFYPCDDVLAPLTNGEPGQAGQDDFKGLAAVLIPNASVIRPLLDSLTRLMLSLRTQARWRVSDLFTVSTDLEAWSGINPKALLQNDEQALGILVEALNCAWHPDQFRHVLMSYARGSEVRLPSGALAMVDKAIAVPQWGTYQIDRKSYLVMPNEAWQAADLLRYAGQAPSGNLLVWVDDIDVPVLANGFPQPWVIRTSHESGSTQPILVQTVAPGLTLSANGRTVKPRPGIIWGTRLRSRSQDADGQFSLELLLDGFQVCLPELTGETLQLEAPQAGTAGSLCFDLDQAGCAALPQTALRLSEPQPGSCELYVQDHASGAIVSCGQQVLSCTVPLSEVMLFNEATGLLVPPSEKPRSHGNHRYLLFAARPINTGAMQMQDIDVSVLGRTGAYDVYRLNWTDASQVLEIRIDSRYQWHFSQRIGRGWDAPPLPPAVSPLAFVANTPQALTVAHADDLLVDDLSHVGDGLLITIVRNNESVAVHTWKELNWLMNFPVENRRFSGAMLRRALHVGPEFDLAGHYTLGLSVGGELLSAVRVTILPQFELIVTPAGLQDEDCHYTVQARAELPVFPGQARQVTCELGQAVVDRDAMENSPFAPRPLEARLRLLEPQMELAVQVHPQVGGYRLLDDNEGTWIRKTNLRYEELDHITLVLFAPNGQKGTVRIRDGEAYAEDFYEGFATFSLASLQGALSLGETQLDIEIDGVAKGALTVYWHPKVVRFELANEYLVDHVAQVEITSVGPVDVPLRLEAFAPDGKRLAKQIIETDGSLDRTVNFAIPNAREFPIVTIKVFDPTEASGGASGTLEVRNASFEPEIEALNARIASEPQVAELRYERAQLLLSKGLRKAASRDFQAAIDLGMKDILDSPQYQQFLTERRAEGFYEDIKALASFFVPFARKELSVG